MKRGVLTIASIGTIFILIYLGFVIAQAGLEPRPRPVADRISLNYTSNKYCEPTEFGELYCAVCFEYSYNKDARGERFSKCLNVPENSSLSEDTEYIKSAVTQEVREVFRTRERINKYNATGVKINYDIRD